MKKFFDQYDLTIGERLRSPFLNENNIYQDGTTPMYRDIDGTLWAMSGHSHMGHIGMFSGKNLDDLTERWPISTNFCVGHAEYAFSGIRYPEGILPRGSIWPFGLYICPNTHRFFCWFHNETGWNGKGTAYDAYVARCRKREDGVMGDFVKYYDGAFCEAGNLAERAPSCTMPGIRASFTASRRAFTS